MNKYIQAVRPDIIREIGKRGVFENKKDETGKVVKKKNEHGSSCFGWGTVDDTIPVHKRELENIRRTLDSIIGQIKTRHYLEQTPSKLLPTGKREAPIEIEEHSVPLKKQKIPTVMYEWHDFLSEKFDNGQIGFIPECFQDSVPPLDDFVNTNTGQVVLNFCKFNKLRF